MTETDIFLEHYGIKGMRWGIRREETASSESYVSKPKRDLSLNNPKVRAAAIAGLAVTGIVAAAFVANHMKDSTKFNRKILDTGERKVRKILEEPTDLIYLSKPHAKAGVTRRGVTNTSLTFISKGKTKDYFEVFDRAGLNSDDFKPGDFRKLSNGQVATIISDLAGRKDSAGRIIPHAVLVPADKATGLNSIEDVIEKFGPELESRYQAFLEASRAAST